MKSETKKQVVTFEMIKNSAVIKEYILAANEALRVKGYTEHGIRHVGYVAKTAYNILRELGYDKRICELAAIAGWTHDIGNSVNRKHHGLVAADMMFTLLNEMGMPHSEIAIVIGALGNHEDDIGVPISPVSAALIIADKSDSHRSRVRQYAYDLNDIHDRTNLSIKKNVVTVCKAENRIRQMISMDDSGSVLEYLQIYLQRVLLTEQAAKFLGCHFELMINGVIINQRRKAVECAPEDGEKQVSED
ncbi:MAG: phosphohydrolase [Firmicutes bacterium]|nr:phosphohydrolase [Bacillota bacterium]